MHDEAAEAEERSTEVAGELDGLEFLTRSEAGEVGHWSIVDVLSQRARDARVSTLVQWAKPIQEKHFQQVQEGSLKLAEGEDPNAVE
jgi:hypothetical protein